MVWPEESHAPYFEYNTPWRGPASEDEEALLDFNLEALLGLGPEVTTSSRGWLKAQGRRIGGHPPQNPLWRI